MMANVAISAPATAVRALFLLFSLTTVPFIETPYAAAPIRVFGRNCGGSIIV
ncbi:hypothetical protein [Mycobacterium paraense]|uniref:hypothetical protein n=1 Tax=Mycobacterium paraense TaxID=767916 RepID=UPI0014832CF0|nr:hypothetical protein [Mycobacterium paraense]